MDAVAGPATARPWSARPITGRPRSGRGWADEESAPGGKLGPDYYDSKINKRRREHDLVRQLEHLTGRKVALTDAA
ncbi:MAG TPA: hypothetical protein VIR33_16660 [Thermopolyspora sp.]